MPNRTQPQKEAVGQPKGTQEWRIRALRNDPPAAQPRSRRREGPPGAPPRDGHNGQSIRETIQRLVETISAAESESCALRERAKLGSTDRIAKAKIVEEHT
eukprot:7220279-Heterocapsa_arctica.AAC.1